MGRLQSAGAASIAGYMSSITTSHWRDGHRIGMGSKRSILCRRISPRQFTDDHRECRHAAVSDGYNESERRVIAAAIAKRARRARRNLEAVVAHPARGCKRQAGA